MRLMIKDVKIVHWEKHKKFYIHAVLELKQLASKEAAVKATVHSPHSVHGKRLRRTLSSRCSSCSTTLLLLSTAFRQPLSRRNNVRYNIAGQRVAADYKGIVIINGKKYLQK